MKAAAQPDRLVDYARRVLGECGNLDGDVLARRYTLPFLCLEARFTDPTYASYCDRALASHTTPQPNEPEITIRVTIAAADTAGLPPPMPWWEPYFLPLEIDARLTPYGLRASYLHDQNIWQFYDSAGRSGAALMSAPTDHPPWEQAAPLRPFLHWIYAGMGMRLTHAATLGSSGRGVLIAGHGGAGKSGTTIAGILAGLDSAGDDYVLTELRESPQAYPIFRLVKQDEAGYRRLGLARRLPDPGPLNWQGKYEFDFEALAEGRRTPSLAIDAILVPQITGEDSTSIVPLSGREAMLALAPSGIFHMPGERAQGARFFAEMIRKVPSFRIELGTRPDEIGGCIAEFIGARP